MAYIYPGPGTATDVQLYLQKNTVGNTSGALVVPALQDVTINAGREIFSWQQLDTASQYQVPTIATNSIDVTLVLDKDSFFGSNVTANAANTASQLGVFGLQRIAQLCNVELFMGGDSANANSNVTITGQGYITGLAPTVAADAPVWTSPCTVTISGDFTIVSNTAPKTPT
jgi:hypothetical protein